MHGHGYITMFLACAYGEEEDKEQREKLEKTIKKAVEFICKSQTNRKHRKPEGKQNAGRGPPQIVGLLQAVQKGEQAEGLRQLVPLGRFGTVEEIAGAAAFLAGPDATYITGTTLTIDGGTTI